MEYLGRKSMAKLGYYEPLSELDCVTADCFALIESEIMKIKASEMKKMSARKR